jgi:hypothetical protein
MKRREPAKPVIVVMLAAALMMGVTAPASASDHLDSPSVIADPRLDIGDLYAWTSTNGRQLNLVMTIVGHSFSDKAEYSFHVDSGKRFGKTTATTVIACTFESMNAADCRVGKVDRITGDASAAAGLAGRNGRSRLYAGLRDDPFFNNVKGSRDAFVYASAELRGGTRLDAAGCPLFGVAQTQEILYRWKHTNHGPAKDFLAGWTPASIVVSVDLDVVNKGGNLLAVWAETISGKRRIDRAGRPLTGNALLAPLAPDEVSDLLKERYNEATPATAAPFIPEIEKSLALYDGYDGQCGNQLLADNSVAPAKRYTALATLLADDRLWVNSASSACTRLFAVEIGAARRERRYRDDCGGRTPDYDAVNIYRSLLAAGTRTAIDDGVHQDEREHSRSVFPFLAAPGALGQYQAKGKE